MPPPAGARGSLGRMKDVWGFPSELPNCPWWAGKGPRKLSREQRPVRLPRTASALPGSPWSSPEHWRPLPSAGRARLGMLTRNFSRRRPTAKHKQKPTKACTGLLRNGD